MMLDGHLIFFRPQFGRMMQKTWHTHHWSMDRQQHCVHPFLHASHLHPTHLAPVCMCVHEFIYVFTYVCVVCVCVCLCVCMCVIRSVHLFAFLVVPDLKTKRVVV